jgi:hypothetical protein
MRRLNYEKSCCDGWANVSELHGSWNATAQVIPTASKDMTDEVPNIEVLDPRGYWVLGVVRVLLTLPEVSLVSTRWWLRRAGNLTPDLDAPSFVLPTDVPASLKVPAEAVQMMVMARGVAPPEATADSLISRAKQLLEQGGISGYLTPEVTAFGTVGGGRHPYVLALWQA